MSVHAAASPMLLQRSTRWGAVLLIVASVAAAILKQEQVRTFEAAVAAAWMPALLGQHVTAAGTGFMITHTADGAVLFNITAECTALVLVVPVTLFLAALLFHQRTSIVRVIVALAVTTTALMVINQGRLALIAWATTVWGIDPGYTISHVFVGSVIGIIGFAGCLVLALVILGIHRRAR